MKRRKKVMLSGIPAAIGMGVLLSLAVTVAVSIITAVLIAGERITENQGIYGAAAALLLAGFCGAMLAAGMAGQKRMLVCLTSGAAYFLLLLCVTAAAFEGMYENIWRTILLVIGSSAAAGFVGMRRNNSSFKGKRRRVKLP